MKKEQPAERKEPEEEDTRSQRGKKQHTRCLRPQTFEETPKGFESLLTANKADTILQRVQMAFNLRDSKRKELH